MSAELGLPRNLLTRNDVAMMLDVPIRKLTWWIWALEEDRRYREFEIQRRSGGTRVIRAPIKPLKDIQRRLAQLLIADYSPPVHVHGFTHGKSIRSNAMPHRRQVWVLRTDLVDFFPSINFGRVRGLFMSFPFEYGEDVATILAQICCHRDELPQGAPTSPVLSNFICRGLDKDLAALARRERCHYSRYADDITFSTDRTSFPSDLAHREGSETHVGEVLDFIVTSQGFKANSAKTRLIRFTQRQRVTGLVVNKQLNVPREYTRTLRKTLYIWQVHGKEAAEAAFATTKPHINWPPEKRLPDFGQTIRGRVQYIGSVKGLTNPVYLSLVSTLSEIDSSYTPSNISVSQSTQLYTEGITDVYHLQAAIRYFHERGEFTELSFKLDDSSALGGDPELRKQATLLRRTMPEVPTVCLFDRDNANVLRELDLTEGDWTNEGNRVIVAALVVPEFRAEPLCVEMLYTDDDLRKRDHEGRRLYLRSEFDKRTGYHSTERCSIPNTKSKTLVCDEVFAYGSSNLALSKRDFAEAILNRMPPFDNVSFEGFAPTFEMLVAAVTSVAE
jgi:RNA-directed DNA polymerase